LERWTAPGIRLLLGAPGGYADPAKVVALGTGPWIFSQWHPSPFEVDGIKYATAEHWMMAGKARLAGDEATLEMILDNSQKKQPDPSLAKRLGRAVRGFDATKWDEAKFGIVVQGSHHKYEQNPELRAYLLSTGDSVLVEASPHDAIWGIRLGERDPGAGDPMRWKGENLLGFALMQVRASLR
jgi:ribA/ribD-fused uncharacterized protein